jgi:cation diffusion facilitator CzcD-associated flavoprotein CzcO
MTALDDRGDRHLILGAGFSGLGVAAAFRRHGVAYDQVEADDEIGGNWYHGVYETVHIISSRKTTEYGDFPMPASWPDFPSKDQMLEYLRAYAEHHRLRERLELRTRVEELAPAPDDRWDVTLADGSRRRYGGVVVANGHHWCRRMPDYPGELSSELIHSKDYKQPRTLEGKRVLVLGGGNSACDIAVEAARFAASAHISMRRGYWFMPKTMLGVPTVELIKPWMPIGLQRAFLGTMLRVIVGPYERYGLARPDHRIFERHPTINTELLHHLRHGRIVPHPDVARFHGDEVEFEDGTRERFDLIVAATGYDLSFPFLAPGVVRFDERGMPDLIEGLLPRRHRNLYFFGIGQPRYGAGPLITAGADMLCVMVDVQRTLEQPLGTFLARLGARPLRSYLQDPHRVLRGIRRGRRMLPRLARMERLLAPPPGDARRGGATPGTRSGPPPPTAAPPSSPHPSA